MSQRPLPLRLRRAAERDVEAAIDFYLGDAGVKLAQGLVDAIEQAMQHIALHPATGSPRYAHELNIPGLRSWRLQVYPYLVFYRVASGAVDVWRVLHEARDIPTAMN